MGERAFVRWQASTREQLGYLNNLLIGLASGGIGLGDKSHPVAAWTLAASIGAGIACAMTRLYDARVTAAVARNREKGRRGPETRELKRQAKQLGRCTWVMLWFQVVAFSVGSLLFVATRVH